MQKKITAAQLGRIKQEHLHQASYAATADAASFNVKTVRQILEKTPRADSKHVTNFGKKCLAVKRACEDVEL